MKDTLNSNTTDFKQCSVCSVLLPLTSYYPKGKGRIDASCKTCTGKKKAKHYKKAKVVEKRKLTIGKAVIRLIPVIQK